MSNEISPIGPPRRSRDAFTLVELLVVIAVIILLVGILFPAYSKARFKAKVSICSNNYRQWTMAAITYSSDDSKGRLPAFQLPADTMPSYQQLEPSWVSFSMATNMEKHGILLSTWFCPLRPSVKDDHNLAFRTRTGRSMSSLSDLIEEFSKYQKAQFISADFFWWVPRQVADSTLFFPDPEVMLKRNAQPWPRQLSDLTITSEPIISDWIIAEWDATRKSASFNSGSGGHVHKNEMSNLNLGFADGHVETRSAGMLQWQAKGNKGSHVYVY